MDYILIVAVSVSLGLIAWAITSAVLEVRHWWEDERDKWRDMLREMRQFFERLEPVMLGLTVAVVAGLLSFYAYGR